jgi:hypothetical protein
MHAAPGPITIVYGAGIAVVAVLGRMHAFSINTGINCAGIFVIAILGGIHARFAIERVYGTVIAVVAI